MVPAHFFSRVCFDIAGEPLAMLEGQWLRNTYPPMQDRLETEVDRQEGTSTIPHPGPLPKGEGDVQASVFASPRAGATVAWFCLLCLLPGAIFAGGPRSKPPPDIVLDYNYHTGHLHNGAGAPLYPLHTNFWPAFCRELRAAPPALLLVGKEAPFAHPASNGAANRARRRFFAQFLASHRDLYDGLQPAGSIAMIVFPDQPVEGLLEARQVHEALRWQGVLCDVLNGDVVDAAALRRYQRAGALPLTFKQQGSKAAFTLPKLRIYEVCEATVRGVTE